jgi:hypothetical protein
MAQTYSVHTKCIPFYCNIAHEPKGRVMKTKTKCILSKLYDQVHNSCHLSFQIFLPEALHSQLLKWCLKYKRLNAYCGFMSLGLQLHCKGDFVWCLEGNHQQKCQFTSDINCLIRLAAFVKGKALRATSH